MRIRLRAPRVLARIWREIKRVWRQVGLKHFSAKLLKFPRKMFVRIGWAIRLPGTCHKTRLAVEDVRLTVQSVQSVLEAQSCRLRELVEMCSPTGPLLQAQSQRLERQEQATAEQGKRLSELIHVSETLSVAVLAQSERLLHMQNAMESMSAAMDQQTSQSQTYHELAAQQAGKLAESTEQQASQLQAYQDSLARQAGELAESTERQASQLRSYQESSAQQARRLAEAIERQGSQLQAHQEHSAQQTGKLVEFIEGRSGEFDAFRILAKKVEMLSLDVRERIPTRTAESIEPRIVNPEAYCAKIEAMQDGLRVNVGCGEKPVSGYINVDAREVPDVDVVAEALNLPFEPGSLAELSSAHLVEHFREYQFGNVVLPYWHGLLRQGGHLRIVCPNWKEMLSRVATGAMEYGDFRLVTFGAQDYEGDDHLAMYTPESLTAVLRRAGFDDVEVVCEVRQNGLCPEMELLAVAAANLGLQNGSVQNESSSDADVLPVMHVNTSRETAYAGLVRLCSPERSQA